MLNRSSHPCFSLFEGITHLPPEQIAADIFKKEQRIAEIMVNIQQLLAKKA
ncbi:MAG TPA: hypothetical protein P5186_22215 [Candidatus Paceibacterota bacterium]|nr:hypothetical protein [Candidatus Paceibacterota bacterium]